MKLLDDCLDCALKYQIWQWYGEKVGAAAKKCGLDATPKPVDGGASSKASSQPAAPTTAPVTTGAQQTTAAGQTSQANTQPSSAPVPSTSAAPGTTAVQTTKATKATTVAPGHNSVRTILHASGIPKY